MTGDRTAKYGTVPWLCVDQLRVGAGRHDSAAQALDAQRRLVAIGRPTALEHKLALQHELTVKAPHDREAASLERDAVDG